MFVAKWNSMFVAKWNFTDLSAVDGSAFLFDLRIFM
jgi:hypothetical protein